MYDDLTSFEHKPIPKILQKPQQIWKIPNIFQKPQILGQKIWNAWLKDEKESYQREK